MGLEPYYHLGQGDLRDFIRNQERELGFEGIVLQGGFDLLDQGRQSVSLRKYL